MEGLFNASNWGMPTFSPPQVMHEEDVLQWVLIAFCCPPAMYQYWLFFSRVFREARERYRGDPTPPSSSYHTFSGVLESVRYGSEPFSATWPTCQVVLWMETEDGLQRNACGWRYGDFLVTAAHCLPSVGSRLHISTDKSPVSVCDFRVKYCHDELAIVEIPISVFSELQVRTAKISATDDTMVRITGCEVFKSTTAGILSATDVLGIYKYSGTTKAGYSGSPYMVGENSVAAMHLFGGDAGNLCISAKYIAMVVQQLVMPAEMRKKLKVYGPVLAQSTTIDLLEPEALFSKIQGKYKSPKIHKLCKKSGLLPEAKSKKKRQVVEDDWYDEAIEAGMEVKARRSRFDPDAYEFQLNDRYYTVDSDSFNRFKSAVKQKGGKLSFSDNVSSTSVGESCHVGGRVDYDLDSDNASQSDSDVSVGSFLGPASKKRVFASKSKEPRYIATSEVMSEILLLRKDFVILMESMRLNPMGSPSSRTNEEIISQN